MMSLTLVIVNSLLSTVTKSDSAMLRRWLWSSLCACCHIWQPQWARLCVCAAERTWWMLNVSRPRGPVFKACVRAWAPSHSPGAWHSDPPLSRSPYLRPTAKSTCHLVYASLPGATSLAIHDTFGKAGPGNRMWKLLSIDNPPERMRHMLEEAIDLSIILTGGWREAEKMGNHAAMLHL